MLSLDAIASFLLRLDLPKVASLTLASLIIASKPLSLSELSERTGYAKSHLSYAVKLLERSSLIERVVIGKQIRFKAGKEALEEAIRKHLIDLRTSVINARTKLDNFPSIEETMEKIDIRFQDLIKQLGGEDDHHRKKRL